jgi:hypothetical protein
LQRHTRSLIIHNIDPMPYIEEAGDARTGLVRHSRRSAKLRVSPEKLELKVNSETFLFQPKDVSSIEVETWLLGLAHGLRIYHNIDSYVDKIIFWPADITPENLLLKIGDIGFQPSGRARRKDD